MRSTILRAWPWLLALVLAVTMLTPAARAQQPPPDDDDDEPQAAAPVVQFGGFSDANFDQWIFQDNSNFSNARQRLDHSLALQIESIDRACKLTDVQKKKLQLAGRGDIKRFFNLYDDVKHKFDLVKNDQQKFQEIWQAIAPLQVMVQSGMYHEDSFLFRSLRHTLTSEQFQHYEAVARERRTFHHRVNIEMAVGMFEMSMPMRAAQRRDFIALLLNLTKPPRRSGQYGYYGLMYQVSLLPEEKLKPLFDNAQWKVVSAQFNQYKGMRQWLKQSGELPDEGEDVAADAQPAGREK
jgi:hypothetical protein